MADVGGGHIVARKIADGRAPLDVFVYMPNLADGTAGLIHGLDITEMAVGNRSGLRGIPDESDFAMAFIDPAFNLLVSPEGMAVMLNGEKPEIDMTTVKIKPSSGPAQTSMSYSRLNKFIVRVKNPEKKSSTTLIFKRHGLFCWKLSSVKWEM